MAFELLQSLSAQEGFNSDPDRFYGAGSAMGFRPGEKYKPDQLTCIQDQ